LAVETSTSRDGTERRAHQQHDTRLRLRTSAGVDDAVAPASSTAGPALGVVIVLFVHDVSIYWSWPAKHKVPLLPAIAIGNHIAAQIDAGVTVCVLS